jgi:uncharacterized protein YndB with AHSA1/START domain
MAPIVESIEINRSPADVCAYLDKLQTHGEWQEAIVSTKTDTDGPVRVGTRATDKRRGPGGMTFNVTYEIVEYDPPRRTRFQVINGPVRPAGTITLEALDGGARSKLTLELDFQAHGIGKLMAPMARRQAAKQVPRRPAAAQATP